MVWGFGLRRRRPEPDVLLALVSAGLPVVPAASPTGVGCSCDRVGCPAPGMHPVSYAWQGQATTDVASIARWRAQWPGANYVSPTGRSHDVLDVPIEVGRRALALLASRGVATGPVADRGDRMLFFTAARGAAADGTPEPDEDEWWPCELDCHPESLEEHPGLRWHNRGSYVPVPPSRLPTGRAVRWIRGPELPLPDPLRLLDTLSAAGEAEKGVGDAVMSGWPYR